MKPYKLLSTMLFALAASSPALAAINYSEGAELVLVLWDPVAKVSYTKDLGLNTYIGTDLELRKNSFFVYAQQDAGYQKFWNLDLASDANFAQFRSIATNTANTVWGIFGADTEPAGSLVPNDLRGFITLQIGNQNGVKSPAYSNMELLTNGDFRAYASEDPRRNIDSLNIGTKPFNTHLGPNGTEGDFALNGSSYDPEGTEGYFGRNLGALATYGTSCNCNIMNSVGNSSWFYFLTQSNDFDETAPIAFDEFDNLGHDGYFGFAQNPANGSFVLSYTLAAFSQSAAATTAGGKARASLTEYIAGGSSRLLSAPVGEFAGYVMPLSPVPEPSSLLLMAGGLAGLVWQRRKRLHERFSAAPRQA